MEACIIINARKKPHIYRRGSLGTFIVPPMENGKVGYLVVRSQSEIQDVGNGQTRRNDTIHARKICEDILGGLGTRLGLLIASAELDIPKSLERAEQSEKEYLAEHPGEVRMRKDPIRKMNLVTTARDSEENAELIALSARVQKEQRKFEAEMLSAVTPAEREKAKANLTAYYQQLCKDGDRLQSVENTRRDIGPQHQEAAEELGYEPTSGWASLPGAREDCGSCGQKVKVGIAICPHCEAVLNDAKAREYKVGPYKVLAAAQQPSK